MSLARSLRVLLAVALLEAWQGALVHPIEHVDEAGALVHLADGHAGGERDGSAPDPLCDAIAALAVGVSGPAGFVLATPQGADAPLARHAAGPRAAVFTAYRSQAPPLYS